MHFKENEGKCEETDMTYSHNINGRDSFLSSAILTMSQIRIYIGQTISVESVLEPPPS